MRPRGQPFIEFDGVTVDERDVAALRGIAEHGSMHAAAEALGRSYARIQTRVDELEAALGPLVERERGGAGGGGSTLTPAAHDLLATFDRLRAEFSGVARTEESVFAGTVLDREGRLGTVETAAGTLRATVPPDADDVQVSVRSDAVALATPDEAPRPTGTSVRNRFEGTVTDVQVEDGLARVRVDVGADAPLRALVTPESVATIGIEPGRAVVASFKATATRAVPAPDA